MAFFTFTTFTRFHAINFFVFVFFVGGGGGGGGGWWCGEERNGVNIELRIKEIWLEKRMPINQIIRQ